MTDTARKGRALVQRVRRFWEAQGAHVEVAPNVVRWIRRDGRMVPISTRHDFYGIWDLLVCLHVTRSFIQVTTVANVAARRRKILASGFPVTPTDAIWAWEGRGHFRIYGGPTFDAEPLVGCDLSPAPRRMTTHHRVA